MQTLQWLLILVARLKVCGRWQSSNRQRPRTTTDPSGDQSVRTQL